MNAAMKERASRAAMHGIERRWGVREIISQRQSIESLVGVWRRHRKIFRENLLFDVKGDQDLEFQRLFSRLFKCSDATERDLLYDLPSRLSAALRRKLSKQGDGPKATVADGYNSTNATEDNLMNTSSITSSHGEKRSEFHVSVGELPPGKRDKLHRFFMKRALQSLDRLGREHSRDIVEQQFIVEFLKHSRATRDLRSHSAIRTSLLDDRNFEVVM